MAIISSLLLPPLLEVPGRLAGECALWWSLLMRWKSLCVFWDKVVRTLGGSWGLEVERGRGVGRVVGVFGWRGSYVVFWGPFA